MKTLRRSALVGAFVSLIISGVLLLNITAPNPTGRRYSSAIPLTTGEGSAGEIGGDGERILAADLRLPNNNLPDQRQCICGAAGGVPGGCNLCVAHSPRVQNFRISDFVAPGFIAEAKNVRQLLVTYERDFRQISEIAAAARESGLPFWVFVRVDTHVDAAYYSLFDGMPGGIVPYFSVPGYVDALDQLATYLLLLALLVIIGVLVWEIAARKTPVITTPVKKTPPPRDPLAKADDAQDFMRRMKDRARRDIDTHDSTNGKHDH